MSKRSLDKKFAGSAVLLQEKMRQDPESYMEEYLQHVDHFDSVVQILKKNPAAVPEKATLELIQVVTGVCHKVHGTSVAERLVEYCTDLLGPMHLASMTQTIVRALLQGLIMMRSRDLVPTSRTLPLFLKLLGLRDKETRKMLLWHISSDIVKANQKSKNHSENRRLQGMMSDIVQEDDGSRSRYVLSLMIDLYRRTVWKDDLTVHFISQALFLRNAHTVKTTLRFLLSRTYTLGAENSDSDEDPGKQIVELKRSFRVRKKNKNREKNHKRSLAAIAKEYEEDGEEQKLQAQHDPILLIREPQDFAEKLLKQLQRTSEKFDVRLLSMQVLARLISTHQLLLMSFYSYLERYMEPFQRDVSSILAVAVQCVHPLVPPDLVTPLLRTIANHFVNDKASPDAITVGLNTIREMCKRQPLIMDTTLLHDLIQYTTYREDKGVVMAARSLLRFFRVMQPDMLPSRERGRGHDITRKIGQFGESKAVENIPGFDLLVRHEQEGNLEGHKNDAEVEEEEEGEGSGGWIDVEHSDDDDDDDDGFVDIPDIDDEEVEEEDGEGEEEEVDDDGEEFEEVSDDDISEDVSEAPALIEAVPIDGMDRTSSAGGNTGMGGISLSTLADRFLTPEDFALMEKLRQKEIMGSDSGKKKMLAGKRVRLAAEADIAEVVESSQLEHHTSKKLKRDKENRLEKVKEERNRHSVGYKKLQKMGARTNAEKKKTKLFQMSQRSRAVGHKLGLSQAKQQERITEQKKKNIKFRIKRGYGV